MKKYYSNIKNILIIFYVLSLFSCIKHKDVKNNIQLEAFNDFSFNKRLYEKSNIINYLPNNYSINGDVDYTKNLQKAINENKNILMPNFPIAINYNGVIIPSNRKIEFQSNSNIIVLPNNKEFYTAFLISNADSVTIINPNIIGDRDNHFGNKGEWGMGIKILSSSNILIKNPMINNFWGDGIYIGRLNNSPVTNQNIKITGGILDYNRRNGISIITGRNITIENVLIKNTNGTNPMAGIDLEPNISDEILYNINLNNIKTFNNKIDGIKIVLHKLTNFNNILININNHNDIGSQNPFTIVGNDILNNRMKGIINYKNAKWSNSNNRIRYQKKLAPELKIDINKISVDGKILNKNFY